MKKTLTIGSRGSELALWQSNHVADLLRESDPDLNVAVEVFSTKGDQILDKPLPEIGGKGLFTAELEAALRDGRIDLAVHSLKDLPTDDAPGLVIGAISKRANPFDAFVCPTARSLAALPEGARVGTSSLRRRAQLLGKRPDLNIVDIRGNVQTRVRKAKDGTADAVILAVAGLERIALSDEIAERLSPDVMLPAAAQGALGVQARDGDESVLNRLARIHDPGTAACVTAERTLLAALGGGCHVPLGVLATRDGDAISLRARVCSIDGERVVETELSGPATDPDTLGSQAAFYLLSNGADSIVSELNQDA